MSSILLNDIADYDVICEDCGNSSFSLDPWRKKSKLDCPICASYNQFLKPIIHKQLRQIQLLGQINSFSSSVSSNSDLDDIPF